MKLKSDQGREFDNKMLKGLYVLTGTEHELGRVEHHNDQARVERLMRTIEESLVTLSQGKKSRWAEAVSSVAFMCRSSYHASLKMSPFERVFGKDMRLPVDALLDGGEENSRILRGVKRMMGQRLEEALREEPDVELPGSIAGGRLNDAQSYENELKSSFEKILLLLHSKRRSNQELSS